MYNSFYPGYAQPYYNPNMQQPQVPQPNPQLANPANNSNANGIIWVQGEAGAKSYIVAPNSTVVLWDAENQTIYVKSADASGMPNTRILDWTERPSTQKTPLQQPIQAEMPTADYVTRAEFDAIVDKINGLNSQIENISTTAPTTQKSAKGDKNNG